MSRDFWVVALLSIITLSIVVSDSAFVEIILSIVMFTAGAFLGVLVEEDIE